MRVGYPNSLNRGGIVRTGTIEAPAVSPALSDVPSITGVPTEGLVLMAVPAIATGLPAPTRSWQWLRNGTPISGATDASYALGAADVGARVSVEQTETNIAGSASAVSTETPDVQPANIEPSPVIIDTDFVDDTNTATFTTDKGGALYWALYLEVDGVPTLNSDGSWTGNVQDSGSVTVPAAGSGSLTLPYTTTTGDRLAYGIVDALGGVSNLIIEVITLLPGVVFRDDFNRPDETLEANPGWSQIWSSASGRCDLVSNAVRNTAGNGAAYIFSGASPADVTVSATLADFNGSTNGNDEFYRLLVRESGSFSDHYAVSWAAPDRLQLLKRAGGSNTILASTTQAPDAGFGNTLRLEVTGTGPVSITAFLNDVEVLSATDSTDPHVSGTAGFMLFSRNTDFALQIDDFLMEGV